MTDQITQTKSFCNLLAIEKGLDPIGSAGNFDDAVIIEMPLPWKYSFKEMDLPEEVITLLDLWLTRYHETGVYGHRPLLIAPDADYSPAGLRRVMFFTKPQGLFAEFEKVEYLVPETKIGDLVWAWYEAPQDLPLFGKYQVIENHTIRDILICTHGSVDVACAKFGYPIYKHLRENSASDTVRVWRVTHFGGHLYAPTMMDMPKGDYWAYVDNAIGEQIVQRNGAITALQNHYRGWSGLERGFMQAMERACLMEVGWQWQDYKKSGEIIAIDVGDDPQWADVRIDYSPIDGITASYQARVSIEQVIITNPASNDVREYAYPQYVVDQMVKVK